VVALDRPGSGPEVIGCVLSVDPELDGVAVEVDIGLGDAERLTGGDAHLHGDEIEPGHGLRHRMLDLDPAVDLDEVVIALRVDEELERADVLVAGRDDRAHRLLGELGAGSR
jgi:hypothetical protein